MRPISGDPFILPSSNQLAKRPSPFFLMDTLYVLCRSVDRRHGCQLSSEEADEACAQKAAYFNAEADPERRKVVFERE